MFENLISLCRMILAIKQNKHLGLSRLTLRGVFQFLLSFALVLFLACSENESQYRQAHEKFALSFLKLTGEYTSDSIDSVFEQAGSMLSKEAQASFMQTVFDAERLASKSGGRSQTLAVSEETIEYELLGPIASRFYFEAERTRKVKGKVSAPILLQYTIVVEGSGVEASPLIIKEVRRDVVPGQDKQLREEVLLNKFNEASAAAAEERKEFMKTVGAVRSDLKEHEKKIEKDFKRLSDSLDKLGSTVRKLGDDVKEQTKLKRAGRAPAKPLSVPGVQAPQKEQPQTEASSAVKSNEQGAAQ